MAPRQRYAQCPKVGADNCVPIITENSSAKVTQRKLTKAASRTISLSQAIVLAAASASLAMVITAVGAAYEFSVHRYESPMIADAIISSTTNRIVSTNTRTTTVRSFWKQDAARDEDNSPMSSFPTKAYAMGDGPVPQVAWLMSFPNSGTSYTLHLTREVSNTTTATNYALEGDVKDRPSIPIHQFAVENGPFLELTPRREKGNTTVPRTFILTKTHCSGYCADCLPQNYIETPRSFQISCQSGRKAFFDDNGTLTVEDVTYDASLVKKAVHVVRNPLDNVVARFHLEWKRHERRGEDSWTSRHPYNATGFNRWCKRQDEKTKLPNMRWIDTRLQTLFESLPCHQEFYRYVQWHNLAFSITRDMGIPTLVIHYQDYRDDMQGTINRLLKFLELPRNGPGEPFHHGKEYRDYYSPAQRKAIEAFLMEYATRDTWENVRDYEF